MNGNLEVLAARMADVCANAVDTDEIAAVLETSGINDRVAERLYGCPDVFALAEQLRRLVPPAPRTDRPPGPPATRELARAVLRAVLWLVPLGLAAVFVDEPWRAWALAALVLGWAAVAGLVAMRKQPPRRWPGHALVGAGQAVLAGGVLVMAGRPGMVALMAGVGLAELILARHRRRVERGLRSLDSRSALRRHLVRGAVRTLGTISAGALLGLAASVTLDAVRGPWFAAAVLLSAVLAVSLLLAAHRRVAAAAALVCYPALLVATGVACLGELSHRAAILDRAASVLPAVVVAGLGVLLAAGLLLAGRALADPRGYR